MTTLDMQQMPPAVAEAIKRALDGEEILLSDQGKPYAKITQVIKVGEQKPTRRPGFGKGKISMATDWDSKEVNDEIAREFGMLD